MTTKDTAPPSEAAIIEKLKTAASLLRTCIAASLDDDHASALDVDRSLRIATATMEETARALGGECCPPELYAAIDVTICVGWALEPERHPPSCVTDNPTAGALEVAYELLRRGFEDRVPEFDRTGEEVEALLATSAPTEPSPKVRQ